MARLTVDYSSAFKKDVKKISRSHRWDLDKLADVIDLIVENTPQSLQILRQRHNMHRLKGQWAGRNECHVANAGDWLVIWSADDQTAFLERTGGHDDLF